MPGGDHLAVQDTIGPCQRFQSGLSKNQAGIDADPNPSVVRSKYQ